jgi:hypothetical protein
VAARDNDFIVDPEIRVFLRFVSQVIESISLPFRRPSLKQDGREHSQLILRRGPKATTTDADLLANIGAFPPIHWIDTRREEPESQTASSNFVVNARRRRYYAAGRITFLRL